MTFGEQMSADLAQITELCRQASEDLANRRWSSFQQCMAAISELADDLHCAACLVEASESSSAVWEPTIPLGGLHAIDKRPEEADGL